MQRDLLLFEVRTPKFLSFRADLQPFDDAMQSTWTAQPALQVGIIFLEVFCMLMLLGV